MDKSKRQQNEQTVKTARYHPDYQTGLSHAMVESRFAEGAVNQTVDSDFKTNRQIIIDNTFTYFNLIFLVLAVLLVVVDSFKNLTFLPVVIANTVIGIVQEIHAKKVLNNLSVMNAATVTTIRNGEEKTTPFEELVLDDIVILKTDDQIPADAVVVKGQVQVNESLLTGESDEITKKENDDLLSGSFIVAGKCYARLDKVGNDAYISKLTLKAKAMGHDEQSKMIKSLNKLIKWVGIIIIPVGLILFFQNILLNHESLENSVISMEAALIGMIPEGLYLLTTIALALSATRLARRQVMLHDMKSVETLARVNVLCLDKTGTITENEMAVQKVIPAAGYQEKGQVVPIETLIGDFAAAMPGDNATMKAIKHYFTKTSGRQAQSKVPFSSVQKFSGVSFADQTYVLGAPEMVLRAKFDSYQPEFINYTQKGYRVLVFGEYPKELLKPVLTAEVRPLGYILIANPVRKEARKTFAYFEKQGVALKVISGDNPLTVSHVATEAGIAAADRYIDASRLTPEQYPAAVKNYTIFGRVRPEQKKQFIQLLKKQGSTVAMTGDGVNDILAMKEADCSIAMASGNSAAMQASQVVLLDSDFSKMPEVVFEGRRVVNNIERSAGLFLVKNIFSLLMAVLAMLLTVSYPLQPTQITLISAFTIGLPSFLLALEDNRKRIRGNFIINILSRSIPGGITDLLVVGALVICGIILDLHKADVSTAATMLLIAVGFMVLFKISQPLNKFRVGVIAASFACTVVAALLFNNLFSLTAISPISILLLIILFFAADSVFRYLTKAVERAREALLQRSGQEHHLSFKEIWQYLKKKKA
ncbi:cation-translocating P-type ATPase [Liquorilactobacillus satsumensis]|uniref:cation-translocating P-type ATPase n=1 Tax=Liquorilactobacillus satsumensis TaxID=259059 RepID=UPI0021C2B93C|nr:cation-translocating P-type ATPase [Liquorilactobacillus satsumensis]MCP9312978.1 cation-translocating P-type ATPase [Liquorilactobacillus satsumensis]MCP9328924.1 cation-translocating P-type ATPase [Liquorilactobacillus satsumensis]MCP9360133.1 cation-translocating P-type ATPase [Liquorilactobacillus satsumensis]